MALLAHSARLAALVNSNNLGKSPWVAESELEVDGRGYRRSLEERIPRRSAENVLAETVVKQG